MNTNIILNSSLYFDARPRTCGASFIGWQRSDVDAGTGKWRTGRRHRRTSRSTPKQEGMVIITRGIGRQYQSLCSNGVRTGDHVRKTVQPQHCARCSAYDAMLAQQNAPEAIARVTEGRNGAMYGAGWFGQGPVGYRVGMRMVHPLSTATLLLLRSCEAASPKLQRSCTSCQTRTATGRCGHFLCVLVAASRSRGSRAPQETTPRPRACGWAGGGRPRKPPSASDASLFASTPADEPWPASLVQYEQLRPAGGPRCRRIARRVEQFRSAHHAPASPGPSGRAKSNSRTWSGTCQSIEAALHVFLDVEGLAGC